MPTDYRNSLLTPLRKKVLHEERIKREYMLICHESKKGSIHDLINRSKDGDDSANRSVEVLLGHRGGTELFIPLDYWECQEQNNTLEEEFFSREGR